MFLDKDQSFLEIHLMNTSTRQMLFITIGDVFFSEQSSLQGKGVEIQLNKPDCIFVVLNSQFKFSRIFEVVGVIIVNFSIIWGAP